MSCQLPLSEYFGLQAFFNSTNGPSWTSVPQDHQWIFDMNLSAPCTVPWFGISCGQETSVSCVVSALNLSHHGLFGTLPPQLSSLSSLELLDVGNNSLSGQLPGAWNNLHKLQTLNIHDGSLFGSIPSIWSSMSQLQTLQLSNNYLTGLLSSSWSAWTSIRTLKINSNSISGTLPSEWGVWTQIEQIDLMDNHIKGKLPPQWQNLTYLMSLKLGDNSLSGTLPISWQFLGSNSSELTLDISDNRLSGQLPWQWGNITNLRYLLTHSNFNIHGYLPVTWSLLTGLRVLGVDNSTLSGSIPYQWSTLTNLVQFSAADNNFVGSIPHQWSAISSLSSFIAQNNSLTGTLPSQWSALTSLFHLVVGGNRLNGTLPSQWSELSQFRYFYGYYNSLSGTVPTTWSKWTSLHDLTLRSNLLTGPLPVEWSTFSSINYLILGNNSLTGTIPSQWSKMSNVYYINLLQNRLTGTIPDSWSALTLLEYIYFSQNKLTGSLPSSWYVCSLLQFLYVQSNSLTGTVPDLYSHLELMKTVDLSGNIFSGTLYSSWGIMSAMEFLFLSSNSFSGTLPSRWSLMKNMIYLYVANNDISGTIPGEWYFPELIDLYVNSNEISGDATIIYRNISFLRLDNNLLTSVDALTSYSSKGKGRSKLTFCNVSTNLISGKLPMTNIYFPWLNLLDMSKNMISGSLQFDIWHKNMPQIQTLILSENCFSGSIQTSVCDMFTLVTLVMDNLGMNKRCSKAIVHSLSPSITGNFPNCIFSLPALETLHIMGNGLYGSLSDLAASSNLSVLALTSNFLVGTIPANWQTHNKWSKLLISHNLITGTLLSNFSVTDSMINLNLSSNRISGHLPTSFEKLSQMDVIEGNIFDCHSNYKNDIHNASYFCGSSELWYVFLVYLVVIAIIILILMFSRDWISTITSIASIVKIHKLVKALVLYAGALLLMILFIRMIVTATASWSTAYTYIYGWISTTVFLHDLTTLVFPFLICGLFFIVVYLPCHQSYYFETITKRRAESGFFNWLVLLPQLLNVAVVSAATFGYIAFVLSRQSIMSQLILSIGLAMFKVLWNTFYVNWMVATMSKTSFLRTFSNELMAGLFSFVVCPIIIILSTDARCFRYILVPIDTVSISYYINTGICTVQLYLYDESLIHYSPVCEKFRYLSYADVQPPWLYSYDCTSSIVTSYVSVVCYSYIIYAVLATAILFRVLTLSREQRAYFKWILTNDFVCLASSNVDLTDFEAVKSHIENNAIRITSFMHSRLIRHLVLLLLFGTASPPLGILILFAIFIEDFMIQAQYTVLRNDLKSANCYSEEEIEILVDKVLVKDIPNVYRIYFPWCLLVVVLYWSFFLFDAIAEMYLYYLGVIACIVVGLCYSFSIYFAVHFEYFQRSYYVAKESATFGGTELVAVSNSLHQLDSDNVKGTIYLD